MPATPDELIVANTTVHREELEWLEEHARGKNLIVEIGSCYGYSTVALAKSGARVLAVDDFYGCRDLKMTDEARAVIFDVFLETTKDYPNITIVKADHKDYYPPIDCDMVFIDGDHTYENVYRDISRFLNHKDILISGHDYEYWPGVKKAVDELLPGVKTFSANLWFKQL